MGEINRDKKYFTFVQDVGAGEQKFYNFEEIQKTSKYRPFKNMVIINEGLTDLLLYINQVSEFLVIPSGTIKELTNELITSVTIENRSTTQQGDFVLSVDNKETELSILTRIGGLN